MQRTICCKKMSVIKIEGFLDKDSYPLENIF